MKTNLWLPKGMGGGKLGVLDDHMNTTTHKIDKQQGPIV